MLRKSRLKQKNGFLIKKTCIRYWDTTNNCVTTHYYNSEFMGKASAQDIYEKADQCLEKLENNKLIQISSEGPNVNLAFLDILKKKRSDDELSQLINIGICGLHTFDSSFKHGEKASDWKINKLLGSMFKFLKNLRLDVLIMSN